MPKSQLARNKIKISLFQLFCPFPSYRATAANFTSHSASRNSKCEPQTSMNCAEYGSPNTFLKAAQCDAVGNCSLEAFLSLDLYLVTEPHLLMPDPIRTPQNDRWLCLTASRHRCDPWFGISCRTLFCI